MPEYGVEHQLQYGWRLQSPARSMDSDYPAVEYRTGRGWFNELNSGSIPDSQTSDKHSFYGWNGQDRT